MKRLIRSISVLSILTALFMVPTYATAFASGTSVSVKDAPSAHLAASALTQVRSAHSDTYRKVPNAGCGLEANPAVPSEAFTVFFYLLSHNYSPPPGLKGNSVYNNSNHKLPNPPSGYRWFEYNVYPGSGTAQRIVTARNGNLTVNGYPYYTPDHYNTFKPMYICKPP
jgi:guanyl-specific ribonuclease Sa